MTTPPPSERSFGLSVGSASLVLAAVLWWRGYTSAAVALAMVGSLLVVFGLAYSPALRGPSRVWWRFAHVLGWINARIILTVFFAVVLTPVGVVMRILGRNPLRPSGTGTNWTPYPARRRDPRHFERLF